MDSLRQQVGNILESTEQNIVHPKRVVPMPEKILPLDVIDQIRSFLPDGVKLVHISDSPKGIQLFYSGRFPTVERALFLNRIKNRYAIQIRLRKDLSEEAEDSQQGAEDDE